MFQKMNLKVKFQTKKGIVLVDFWAAWCGPCKMIAPILEQVSQEMPEIEIAKVDVDQNQGISMQYGIQSIPTLMIFKDGQLVDKKVGFMPKEMLMQAINEHK